jgi:tripartite ATP-independent transporter DctP family solute receptor
MMLKKSRCLVLAMVLILVVVSCTTFAAAKPIKIVLGSQTPSTKGNIHAKADRYFKELVEKKSNGQILVDIFFDAQLGSIPEQIQAVKNNAQQMTYTPLGEHVPFWSKLATFDLPFLYRDSSHLIKAFNLIERDEIASQIGLRILGTPRIRLPRQLTTKFPVEKVEDIKGLKIRVPESPVSMAMWRAFGAIPTVIPFADLYTALATGTVDAQENPFESIIDGKLYEQVKYCALTGHKREGILISISEKFWKTLTKKQQKIILDAVTISNKSFNKEMLNAENDFKNVLIKNGMKFTNPDIASFRSKIKPVWSQFGDEKLIDKIQKIK